jgi:hypothetical protein
MLSGQRSMTCILGSIACPCYSGIDSLHVQSCAFLCFLGWGGGGISAVAPHLQFLFLLQFRCSSSYVSTLADVFVSVCALACSVNLYC